MYGLRILGLYPTFKEWKLGEGELVALPAGTGLYPTFKEWKPWIWRPVFCCGAFVYILPLRNENKIEKESSTLLIRGLYPTFKEWKQDSAADADWKAFFAGLYPTFKEWKRGMHWFFVES